MSNINFVYQSNDRLVNCTIQMTIGRERDAILLLSDMVTPEHRSTYKCTPHEFKIEYFPRLKTTFPLLRHISLNKSFAAKMKRKKKRKIHFIAFEMKEMKEILNLIRSSKSQINTTFDFTTASFRYSSSISPLLHLSLSITLFICRKKRTLCNTNTGESAINKHRKYTFRCASTSTFIYTAAST